MITIIMYLRVWAIVWKQHTEILEMTMKKMENYTSACTDSEAVGITRKRKEDTGWVSKFINILLLYIVHLILVNGNLLAVGHPHVFCLGS